MFAKEFRDIRVVRGRNIARAEPTVKNLQAHWPIIWATKKLVLVRPPTPCTNPFGTRYQFCASGSRDLTGISYSNSETSSYPPPNRPLGTKSSSSSQTQTVKPAALVELVDWAAATDGFIDSSGEE